MSARIPLDFLTVISQDTSPCPYLDETALMPLSLGLNGVTIEQFDQVLAAGYRRTGHFFYDTRCPNCVACEPVRVDVGQFKPNRSQRRALKRGDQELELRVAEPVVDDQRVDLFNRHRKVRNLESGDGTTDAEDYRSFLVDSLCPVLEFSFWKATKLVMVAITDVSEQSLSAVYCYFDPDYSYLSPGTYSIMKQIELCHRNMRRWFYLGMYVEQNKHLCYKANFLPQQRLIGGLWVDFARDH